MRLSHTPDMKHALLFFCALFLASCVGPTNSLAIPAPLSEHPQGWSQPASVKFAHIFSFNGSNGKEPAATLIDVNGTLYGTTYAGGANNDGTVFELEASGSQTLLHSFKGGRDGALPLAGLTDVGGTLYGTTVNGGGPSGEGVVFKLSSSGGGERVLHHFGMVGDGANPYAQLINVHGTLYGTTAGGGTNSEGTIFTVSRSGKTNVLYSFNPAKGDGATPVAELLNVNGALYGTTAYGGSNCGTVGCGAVFKITTGGSESVLYSFNGGNDGANPSAPLVDVRGTLYGTTAYGGKYGDGTVFKISTSGKESVLYNFQAGSDGAVPQSLALLNGTLYGTTSYGGSKNFGTVFSITTAGKESVIYTFKGAADGATPRAGLVASGGTLYGTTAAGGGNQDGTVFSITP